MSQFRMLSTDQRSTEGTIFGRSRSRSRSHKTFGFWPKAEAVAEGTNYDRMRRNQLQKEIFFRIYDGSLEFYLIFIKMKSVQFVTSNLVTNTALECIANQFMRTNEDQILKLT